MKVMYMTGGFKTLIAQVEVVRETNKSVWTLDSNGVEHRSAKRSQWYNFFDKWSEARSFLIEQARLRCESCRSRYEYAQKKLDEAEDIPLAPTLELKKIEEII